MYVVDSGNSLLEAFSATTGATDSNFSSPQALTGEDWLAVSGTSLYAVDSVNNTIGVYNAATGATVSDTLVNGNTLGDALGGPIAVCNGDIYVGNNINSISEFNASTAAAITSFQFPGIPDGFDFMAISGGRLYVASDADDTIGVYDATTGAAIDNTLLGAANGIEGITGLTISGTDLYVASMNDNTANPYDIGKYNATNGNIIDAALISSAEAATYDYIAYSGGELYVLNENAPAIDAYNATNGALIQGSLVSNAMDEPVDLAIGAIPEPGAGSLFLLSLLMLAISHPGARLCAPWKVSSNVARGR